MVYFVQNKTTGLVKIGTTVRLSERLNALKSQAKTDLHVIGVVDGDRAVEADMHLRFAAYRMQGEWFWPSAVLMSFVEKYTRRWDGRDDVPMTTFRIDSDLARLLEQVSTLRGVSVSDYIRSDLAPLAHEHLLAEAEKIIAAGA